MSSLWRPAGQRSHGAPADGDTVPGAHGLHLPSANVWPGVHAFLHDTRAGKTVMGRSVGHLSQKRWPLLSWNVPGGHNAHSLTPRKWYWPGLQMSAVGAVVVGGSVGAASLVPKLMCCTPPAVVLTPTDGSRIFSFGGAVFCSHGIKQPCVCDSAGQLLPPKAECVSTRRSRIWTPSLLQCTEFSSSVRTMQGLHSDHSETPQFTGFGAAVVTATHKG